MKEAKKIKQNNLSILTSFIIEFISLGNRLDIKEEQEKTFFNFLFINDDNIKEAVAYHYINHFIEIYESKEFQDYLKSNNQGYFEIIMRTDEEIIKEKEIMEKYNMLEDRLEEIMTCEIIPSLEILNKQNKIIFNLNSQDTKIIKISNNIIKFISNLIISFAEMYLENIDDNKNKTIGIMSYLFLDNNEENKNYKKILCNGMINSFLHYYDKYNFENTDFDKYIFKPYSSKDINN